MVCFSLQTDREEGGGPVLMSREACSGPSLSHRGGPVAPIPFDTMNLCSRPHGISQYILKLEFVCVGHTLYHSWSVSNSAHICLSPSRALPASFFTKLWSDFSGNALRLGAKSGCPWKKKREERSSQKSTPFLCGSPTSLHLFSSECWQAA